MKRFWAVLIFLLSAAGIAPAGELKILTYNIHHGEGLDRRIDLERIVAIIRAEAPDVVCLQEVDRGMERTDRADFPKIFSEMLGMAAVFEPNLLRGGGEYGNATFTRHEIVRSENVKLPGPPGIEPRGCLKVTIRMEGREIEALNTHLGLKAPERLEQAKAIQEHLGRGLQVLAGDLNEPLDGPGVQILLGALRNTGPGAGEGNGTVNGGSRQIDFILASPEFEVLSARVIRDDQTAIASDHLPYVVKFRFDR